MGALARDETTSHTHNITKATIKTSWITDLNFNIYIPIWPFEGKTTVLLNGEISDLLLKYLLSQGWHLQYLIIFGILSSCDISDSGFLPCDTE